MTIGEKIRAIRLQKGLSQETLEQRSGIKRNFISLIENGHRGISYRTLEKIALAMSVSVGEITDYKPPVYRSAAQIEPYPLQIADESRADKYNMSRLKRENHLLIPVVEEAVLAKAQLPIDQAKIKDYVPVGTTLFPDLHNLDQCCCFYSTRPESIFSPLITKGHLVCLDYAERDPIRLSGKTVAFSNKSHIILRKLSIKGKNIIGLPYDPGHRTLVVPIQRKHCIIGRIIWLLGCPD
jgi:transcriptional regulator with XRE-family HTH domain